MTIQAGRKGSTGPAATFAQGLQLTNVIGLDTAWPHLTQMPKDLNFVVYGDMTFNIGDKSYTFPDFRVAQGHHGTKNNWWLGSSDCAIIPETHQYTCCCGNRMCNSSILPTPGSTNYAI